MRIINPFVACGLLLSLANSAYGVTAKVCCNDGSSWTIFQNNPGTCAAAEATAAIACTGHGGFKAANFKCPAFSARTSNVGCSDVDGNEVCESADPACAVPTVSEWGLAVMTLLLLTAGTVVLGRLRRSAAPSA